MINYAATRDPNYKADLSYGYEITPDGEVFHSFELTDPKSDDLNDMGAHLAEALECDPDDSDFNWDVMEVALPQTLVDRIKADAVEEYKAQQKQELFIDTPGGKL